MTSNIGLAIIGCGIFAREQHLPSVLKCEAFHLLAVHSRSKASTDVFCKAAHDLKWGDLLKYYDVDGETDVSATHGLKVLLARQDIKAVIIALPIPTQPAIVRECLAAGKHVLCEKPIAASGAEGVELIKYYADLKTKNPGLIYSVAENYRFEEGINQAALFVHGSIGKLRFFSMEMLLEVNEDNKYYNTSWRTVPSYDGGFLLDGGVHWAAALRKILPKKIVSVAAFTRQNKEILPPIDTFHSTLRLEDGTTGTFAMSFASTYARRVAVFVGESGSVEIEALSDAWKVTTKNSAGVNDQTVHKFAGVLNEIKSFGGSIATGTADASGTPEAALHDCELMGAIFLSGRSNGQPVAVNL